MVVKCGENIKQSTVKIFIFWKIILKVKKNKYILVDSYWNRKMMKYCYKFKNKMTIVFFLNGMQKSCMLAMKKVNINGTVHVKKEMLCSWVICCTRIFIMKMCLNLISNSVLLQIYIYNWNVNFEDCPKCQFYKVKTEMVFMCIPTGSVSHVRYFYYLVSVVVDRLLHRFHGSSSLELLTLFQPKLDTLWYL